MKTYSILIPAESVKLGGELVIPEGASAVILFSHGSGSSRFSKRNQFVAKYLQEQGFATLLFDLLTEQEDEVYENRFNIALLTRRLISVTLWLGSFEPSAGMQKAYFGASTGAASAMEAAAQLGYLISAVVSRGGRPDLAIEVLHKITAPVLLIIGENDEPVIEMNKQAMEKINCLKELVIVPGATHLFEEPGKLEKVAELAASWYKKHIR